MNQARANFPHLDNLATKCDHLILGVTKGATRPVKPAENEFFKKRHQLASIIYPPKNKVQDNFYSFNTFTLTLYAQILTFMPKTLSIEICYSKTLTITSSNPNLAA